jgi:glycosyltransferase involved in cell wall biosynthesis
MSEFALRFDVNAFDTGQPVLDGRQVASRGFLEAALGAGSVAAYGVEAARAPYESLLAELSPGAAPHWIPADRIDRFSALGVCQRMDAWIAKEARLRQWVGPAEYSLCGVLHTTVGVLEDIAGFLHEPLMPWDAVVCPSEAVRRTVEAVLEAQAEYLRWRLGPEVRLAGPALPVIPLGIDCESLAAAPAARDEARAALGLAPDEVAALYVGRMAPTTKAHPWPMYAGLQAAARASGVRFVLIECGYAMNPQVGELLKETAAQVCPDVRRIVVDGRSPPARDRCWAAADVFMSLSDNVQETFGLTPIEAMAAGVPAVVTDWNGYRESIVDGETGFRIATCAPEPGMGAHYGFALERGLTNVAGYVWAAAASTSVDLDQLSDRLCALAVNPDLRRRMGAAGQARARAVYDWRGVFAQYQALWRELADRRRAAGREAAPRMGAQADPFAPYAHYPTRQLSPASRISLRPGADAARRNDVMASPMFPASPASPQVVDPLWALLERDAVVVGEAAQALQLPVRNVLLAAGALAKMGLVAVSED